MTIINILDYADSYLRAAIKKYGGYPSSSKARFLSTPKISEPEWYYPAKESVNAYEIGKQSGSYPNHSSTSQNFNVPIRYPVSTTSSTKTINGFKTDKSISKNLNLNLGINAKIPNLNIPGGFEIEVKPGAEVSRNVKTNQTVDFSSTSEKTQNTNDTPSDTTQSFSCPPNTKATYIVIYFGGEPKVEVTAVTDIIGNGSGIGTDPTTGQEKSQRNVLATLDYSKEGQAGKKYTMMVTADQLATKIPGYNPPPRVEQDRSHNALTIHSDLIVNLKEDFAYEIIVKFENLSYSTLFNEDLFIYRFDKNHNLLIEKTVGSLFETNLHADIFYEHIESELE
ncbi:hypothetical protein ABE42_30545 [Bacillus thuringiensis]|uniref:hypothetical protein n=1 Tax=Bacillus thuringiensis TaxID=1428 RepID=UPI0018F86F57|nr:hypothetical protein [Bacillus thuringiensis]MBG9537566.1 hypothetical protein [Bacillus thuringiensis]MBG9583439.1 hypothetical protein [Bacillus thuringiensis]